MNLDAKKNLQKYSRTATFDYKLRNEMEKNYFLVYEWFIWLEFVVDFVSYLAPTWHKSLFKLEHIKGL